jgi:hypothetical protein
MKFSRQDLKNFDGPIGDPFGGPAASKLTGQKYQDPVTAIAITLQVASAYGSIKAGQDRNKMYQMQARQAEVESDRRAVQYELQANDILRRTNQANAAVVARGFAGGIQGFEGSASLIQTVNNTRGGKDFMFALQNSDMTKRSGLIQASLYEGAGQIAEQAGYFDAAGKLGSAGLSYARIGSAPGGERAGGAAPIYENRTPV